MLKKNLLGTTMRIIQMKLVEGINYRQWQQRNTKMFNSLTKKQKRECRQLGYCNMGWLKVQKSWQIINDFTNKENVISLFDYRLSQGDLIGAIDLAILDSERAKLIAKEGQNTLNTIQTRLDDIANKTLLKYPLL